MIDPLPRLLKTYEFFNLALAEHGARLGEPALRQLGQQRDQAFLDILMHAASDVRVTVAQLGFIVSNLDRLATDPKVVPSVQAACARHLKEIAAQVQPRRAALPPPPAASLSARRPGAIAAHELAALDLLTDRASVLDRDYRYVFTNAANASFHGRPAHDFIGRLNPDIVGNGYFERFSRAHIDRALAGEHVAFIASHPLRDASHLYSVMLSPVCDDRQAVVGVLIVARDVSHLPLPAEINAYRPEA